MQHNSEEGIVFFLSKYFKVFKLHSYFYNRFETRLIPIMEEALKTYKSLDSQSQADGFKHRIMQIFRAWEDWDIYPKEFLFRCQNTFLGLSINEVNFCIRCKL